MAVGRFQVMALLQAARAIVLGLPMESAKSWGLNRAIFYAAAKRGFKGGKAMAERRGAPRVRPEVELETYRLGDEMAYRSKEDKLLFEIGGETQTETDFRRQIESRFQGKFPEAWEEGLDYVKQFERGTLLSGSDFFSSVYRPKRDEFAAKWSALSETNPEKKVAAVVVRRRRKQRSRP